jgi:hypothetical protein
MNKEIFMKNIILISLLVMLGACAATVDVPQGEYIECKHIYSDNIILAKEFSDIKKVGVNDCSDIIRYPSGDCPSFVKIVTIDENVEWLTLLEFENYECIKREGTQ